MKLLTALQEKYPERFARAKKSRRIAVHLKCLDCQNDNHAEVARCQITACPLWPWRSTKATAEGRAK